jgi:hypothetical protein
MDRDFDIAHKIFSDWLDNKVNLEKSFIRNKILNFVFNQDKKIIKDQYFNGGKMFHVKYYREFFNQ